MDYLMSLRELARGTHDKTARRALRNVADRLDRALTDFSTNPTEAGLIELNGAWANAARVVRTVPPEGQPGPAGGAATPFVGTQLEVRKAA